MKAMLAMLAVGILCAGCGGEAQTKAASAASARPSAMVAARVVSEAINVDGRLDEQIWQQAAAYQLYMPADNPQRMHEQCTVRLAWDEEHLYVGIDAQDSDIVQENGKDQQHHYQSGDVFELFLKPDDQTWYWELYVTPQGNKTTFFLPGRGRMGIPSNINYSMRLKVAARVDGTVNDWQDKDTGWTAEMAVPLAELAAKGSPLTPATRWSVLAARYNFSRYLDRGAELSSAPQLPTIGWHAVWNWTKLELQQH